MADIERIRCHIRALEWVRHLVAAPQALERDADYVAAHLIAPGYEVTEHRFSDDGRHHCNIVVTRREKKRDTPRLMLAPHLHSPLTCPHAGVRKRTAGRAPSPI